MTMEMTPQNLCELMYLYRLNAKKTAALLHVSVGSIYHWRTGTRKMPLAHWECLNLKLEKLPKIVMNGSDWSVQ